MDLQTLARRPHPCSPWTTLNQDAQEALFPGGLSASPQAFQKRAEHLGRRQRSALEFSPPFSDPALTKVLSRRHPVVLTGQQPALLGGPFFVWLKAAGAILAARKASQALGAEVLPLFWIAGDDSDLPEVRSLRDPLRRQGLTLDFGAVPTGTPVGQLVPSPSELSRARESVASWWPRSEAATLLEGSPSLSEVMRRCLKTWFPELAVLDAAWPGLRSAFAPAYADFARRPSEIGEEIAHGIAAATSAGLPVTLRALQGRTRLFSLEGGVRIRIPAPEDPKRLAQEVLKDPERFSHDAASRIFAAEEALPVLAHILGPGEYAYVACLAGVQRSLQRPFAPALPRPSLTLLPPGSASLSREADHDLSRPGPRSPHPFHEAFLRGAHPELGELETHWRTGREAYLSAVAGHPDAGPARRLAAWEARELRRRMEALAPEHAEKLADLTGLWSWLGAGSLQERSWSPWALESRLGIGTLATLSKALPDLDSSCHTILEAA